MGVVRCPNGATGKTLNHGFQNLYASVVEESLDIEYLQIMWQS